MTEEQVLFYTIGKLGALFSFAYVMGWSIVSVSGVLSSETSHMCITGHVVLSILTFLCVESNNKDGYNDLSIVSVVSSSFRQ